MKKTLFSLLIFGFSFIAFAGGDYGGGPKVIELYKLDHSVSITDIKLSKDKKKVELELFYKKRRTEHNPFVGEKEAQKLLFGKSTPIYLEYEKDLFNQELIDKLKKRKRFILFKKKYKKMAKETFVVEEISEQVNKKADSKYFEVRSK